MMVLSEIKIEEKKFRFKFSQETREKKMDN